LIKTRVMRGLSTAVGADDRAGAVPLSKDFTRAKYDPDGAKKL